MGFIKIRSAVDGEGERSAADEAMDRYADGDEAAFAAVYDGVAPRLAAFVRRSLNDPAGVDDVIQQTFLRMHRARRSFVRGGQVLPWAFAIVRRLIIDGARRHRWTRAEEFPPEPSTAVAEDLLFTRETARLLLAELERLPASQRAAFELLRHEGLSLRQAAGRLGTTANAVKLRADRALAALRSVMEPRPSRASRRSEP